jgi:hypothetical protein
MNAKSAACPADTIDSSGARSPGIGMRIGLLAAHAVLTLPVIPLLVVTINTLRPLLLVDLCVRAIPLYVTALFDRAFLDGGEVTPQLMPLWVVLTGIMLWPLLALGVRPQLWQSGKWRRRIGAYGFAVAAGTVAAASWVFTHLGIFF